MEKLTHPTRKLSALSWFGGSGSMITVDRFAFQTVEVASILNGTAYLWFQQTNPFAVVSITTPSCQHRQVVVVSVRSLTVNLFRDHVPHSRFAQPSFAIMHGSGMFVVAIPTRYTFPLLWATTPTHGVLVRSMRRSTGSVAGPVRRTLTVSMTAWFSLSLRGSFLCLSLMILRYPLTLAIHLVRKQLAL
jgi:hypothetical protein